MRTTLLVAAIAAIVVGGVNFFWFLAESQALGGDALNGYASNGQYYVCAHGACREVVRETWEWNRAHAISVWITHPLAMLGMAYVLFGHAFPAYMGVAARGGATERVSAVEASGPRATTFRGGGVIGSVSMTAPFLSVAVYPAGLVLKPMFMRAVVIRASELRRVRATRPFLSSRLEIEHAGVEVPSPVVLYAKSDSAIARAVTALVPISADNWPTDGVAVGVGETVRRRFDLITGVSNVAIGLGLIYFVLAGLLPSDGIFALFMMAIALVIIAAGIRRLSHRT